MMQSVDILKFHSMDHSNERSSPTSHSMRPPRNTLHLILTDKQQTTKKNILLVVGWLIEKNKKNDQFIDNLCKQKNTNEAPPSFVHVVGFFVNLKENGISEAVTPPIPTMIWLFEGELLLKTTLKGRRIEIHSRTTRGLSVQFLT